MKDPVSSGKMNRRGVKEFGSYFKESSVSALLPLDVLASNTGAVFYVGRSVIVYYVKMLPVPC